MNTTSEKHTILVVDDEPMILKIVERLLKDDYNTITANNGKKALKLATSDPMPDLIILDVMMPEMDGYEVCRQLKANKLTADIPVFFFSAIDRDSEQIHGFELGAVEYISKPFNPTLLRARIRSHIELRKKRDMLYDKIIDSTDTQKTSPYFIPTTKVDTGFYLSLMIMIFLVLSVSWGVYISEVSTLQVIIKNDERNTVEQEKKVIENALTSIFSDIKVVATSSHLYEMFEEKNTHPRSQLEKELRIFCQYKNIYDQVRFLDKNGMEVIRINYNGGAPVITPENALQYKGNRYYFSNTIKLLEEEIFVSPFDLNIEHGKIEQPLKPVIRFGTPVFNVTGEKMGVILFNYLGQNLLDLIGNIAEGEKGDIILLNSHGYFLKSPEKSDEWGFMYKENNHKTFDRKFISAWSTIAIEETGQFDDQDGIFTFTTIRPWSGNLQSGITDNSKTSHEHHNVKTDENYWKVVSHVSKKTLETQTSGLLKKLLVSDIAVIILLGCALWLTSSARIRRKAAENSLKISEERLSELFNNMGSGVVIYSPSSDGDNFHITDINRRTEFLEKIDRKTVKGKPMNLIFPEVLEAGLSETLKRVWSTSHAELFPVSIYQKENLKRYMECYVYKLPTDELVVIYDDATGRKQAEEVAAFEYALNEASAKIATTLFTTVSIEKVSAVIIEEACSLTNSDFGFTAFIDSVSDELILSGIAGKIKKSFVNERCPMFKNKNGLMQQIMANKKPVIINSTDELRLFDKLPESHIPVNRLIAVPTFLENRLIGLMALANTERDFQEKDLKILEHLTSLFSLTVQQYEAEQKIRYLAHHDPLTGLANRNIFTDRINQAMAASRRTGKKAAFLYIDLDDFKPINDELGHKAGDLVLKEVANRLNVLLRETDTICRIGGDEFVIILQDLGKKEDAGKVAEKIIVSLTQPIPVDTKECVVGASIGISLYPDDGQDIDSIQKKADAAMYRIKERSKNSYAFYEEG